MPDVPPDEAIAGDYGVTNVTEEIRDDSPADGHMTGKPDEPDTTSKYVRPDSVILSATRWTDNSYLIAACAELGYLQPSDQILDPTYENGIWWKQWRPDPDADGTLTTHDISKDGVDYRHLPHADESFDVVTYDPPYVAMGGRDTSGMPDFLDRFGLYRAPRTVKMLRFQNHHGLIECTRVLKYRRRAKGDDPGHRGGILLMKCQPYVSSGKLNDEPQHYEQFAALCGLELVDRLMHLGDPRPQDETRNQAHSRNNYSTLLVFRKGTP